MNLQGDSATQAEKGTVFRKEGLNLHPVPSLTLHTPPSPRGQHMAETEVAVGPGVCEVAVGAPPPCHVSRSETQRQV